MAQFIQLIVILFLAAGCAAKPIVEPEITLGTFKNKILRGKTTQKEVMGLLGSPSITSRNAQGNPIWTYTRQAFDQEHQRFAGGVTVFGGDEAFTSSSSSSYDIIVTFDGTERVKDYSVIASEF